MGWEKEEGYEDEKEKEHMKEEIRENGTVGMKSFSFHDSTITCCVIF